MKKLLVDSSTCRSLHSMIWNYASVLKWLKIYWWNSLGDRCVMKFETVLVGRMIVNLLWRENTIDKWNPLHCQAFQFFSANILSSIRYSTLLGHLWLISVHHMPTYVVNSHTVSCSVWFVSFIKLVLAGILFCIHLVFHSFAWFTRIIHILWLFLCSLF